PLVPTQRRSMIRSTSTLTALQAGEGDPMVAHLFPASPDPANRRLVVLVHGFGSSKRCWEPLLALWRADTEVCAGFDFACFEYPTAWANARFLRRIPQLLEIARSLSAFLALPELAVYD